MYRQKNKIIISWIPVLLWMSIIFILSNQPATESNGLSRNVTEVIIEKIGKLVPADVEISTANDLVSQWNHIVRKLAHFSIYFMLGVLVINAFKKSLISNNKAFIFSVIFCIIYAASDEIHQIFVLGRGCQLKDVLIDSSGAIMGIVLYQVVNLFINKTNSFN